MNNVRRTTTDKDLFKNFYKWASNNGRNTYDTIALKNPIEEVTLVLINHIRGKWIIPQLDNYSVAQLVEAMEDVVVDAMSQMLDRQYY